MPIFLIIFFLFVGLIALFAFPQLSPIPYFPSNRKDMSLILKALQLKNDQVIIDLGAGDGIIVFEAAKKAAHHRLNTTFVAVEINPVLVLLLHFRRLISPHKNKIRIVWGDLFKIDYSTYKKTNSHVTLYLYVTPRLMPEIINVFKKSVPSFTLVSYLYPLDKTDKPVSTGVHPVFIRTF